MSKPAAPRPALERVSTYAPTTEALARGINTLVDDLEVRLEALEKFIGLPQTTINGIRLRALAAEPSDAQEGVVVLADDTNWDPLTLTLGRPYLVLYSGGAWRRLDA